MRFRKLIGAGLHGVVEVPAARLAVLGRVVTGLDRHLLDRFHARLNNLVGPLVHPVGGVLPFNVDGLRVGWDSVN